MALPERMTEDQVERATEHMIDSLDRKFLFGPMSQARYDFKMRQITDWAEYQLAD